MDCDRHPAAMFVVSSEDARALRVARRAFHVCRLLSWLSGLYENADPSMLAVEGLAMLPVKLVYGPREIEGLASAFTD